MPWELAQVSIAVPRVIVVVLGSTSIIGISAKSSKAWSHWLARPQALIAALYRITSAAFHLLEPDTGCTPARLVANSTYVTQPHDSYRFIPIQLFETQVVKIHMQRKGYERIHLKTLSTTACAGCKQKASTFIWLHACRRSCTAACHWPHFSHALAAAAKDPRREAMPTSQASPDYFGVTVRSCRRCQMSSYVFSTLWHSLNMFMLLNANQVKKHKYVIIIRIYDMISCSTARRDFTWIRVPQHQSSLLVVTS